MSVSRGLRRVTLALVTLAGMAGVPPAFAADLATDDKPAFKVCVLTNNTPYSSRESEQGFDLQLAAAVANAIDHRLEPVWIDNDERISEIDESDMPVGRLGRGDCDAIFSMPGPPSETLGGRDGVTLGEPYYGAAFELVSCQADPPIALRGLRGKRVAIQSQTIAHFALMMVKAEPRNFFSTRGAFGAALKGEADAALLWGPSIGYELMVARKSGLALRDKAFAACRLVADYEPPRAVRWNLHVATRVERARLRERIDAALADLTRREALHKLMKRWGIPQHLPFETTYSLGAVNELQRAR